MRGRVSRMLKEILGVLGVGRVLVKVPDFRLSRVQNTPRILVLFWRVSMCLLISKIFYVPNPFCAVLEKFSRCSRSVGIFSRVQVRCF